jgi:1-deoxy-D-xylulose-5-phosphate reductoisomerase
MKNIVILGSTGSIGTATLQVVSAYPDRFRVAGLTAGRNVPLLLDQISVFKPEVVAVPDDDTCAELKKGLSSLTGPRPEVLYGVEGICRVAEMTSAHVVISAIVGSAGLLPTLCAVRSGKTVGLANKETLVMAGDIVMSEAAACGSVIIPVDSEHSAVFQCLQGHERKSLARIILTASGGPFIGRTHEEMKDVTPDDALKHPNWSMGRKISIDSATLMNKGLEVIEACRLFDLPAQEIDVLIHPQSIIHSMVEFIDGSLLAQLSRPDMKGPIAYALSWPERLDSVMEAVPWADLAPLTFQGPDREAFPCLSLAYSALEAGGTMPAVLNASNETAVQAFLDGIVRFTDIPAIIKKVMDSHAPQRADDIAVILEADRWAREESKIRFAGL